MKSILLDIHLRLKSDCAKCKHRYLGMECPAYPDGIPYELTQGIETHRTVREDQEGTFVFINVYEKTEKIE